MKLWVGKEMEGKYKGKTTLFIQSSILDKETLCVIFNYLQTDSSIEQLYFGAGRVDIESIDKGIKQDLEILFIDYLISVEFSHKSSLVMNELVCDQYIYRIMTEKLNRRNIVIKVDDEDDVYCIDKSRMIHTSLQNLKNCQFESVDKEVFNNEKGEK